MATPTKYPFNKTMDIYSLVSQIQASSIVTVLDHIEDVEGETDIWFKDVLSEDDQAALGTVVDNYILMLPPVQPAHEVITQFEKRDKTLKLVHGVADVQEDGTATILLKVPGTPGSADGRWISSGISFFDVHTPGDKVTCVYFTDEDNIMQQGAGFVVGSYTDDDADEEERGWAIPPNGFIKAEAIGGYGFAPAGFYIKIMGKKAGDSPAGKFYVNIEWGKTDS